MVILFLISKLYSGKIYEINDVGKLDVYLKNEIWFIYFFLHKKFSLKLINVVKLKF